MTQIKFHSPDRYFYFSMSILTFLLVLIGFSNFYGPKILSDASSISPVIHIHASIFSTWMLVFVTQCLLILNKRIKWHIRLGTLGFGLAWIMLISGFITAIEAAREGHKGIPGVEFTSSEGFLLLNISSICIFTLLATLAWMYRKNVETHKRLILMATTLGLTPPGISRLPLVSGHMAGIATITLLVVLAGPLYDLIKHRRIHQAYTYSLPLVLGILPPVVSFLSFTETWKTVARQLIGQ